ncbi:permease prefix domain 1-containing protein [Guggenheimella bovis]
MKTIQLYLDNLFTLIPATEENQKMKENLLRDSEEYFNELIQSGKTEAEATTLVIERIGNIEDLKEHLSLAPTEKVPTADEQMALREYRSFQKKFNILLPLGIACCIIGIFLGSFLESNDFQEGIVTLGFFGPITIGVALIIFSSMQLESLKEAAGLSNTSESSSEQSHPYTPVVWIVAVAVYLLLGFVFHLWHPGWIIFLIATAVTAVLNAEGKDH